METNCYSSNLLMHTGTVTEMEIILSCATDQGTSNTSPNELIHFFQLNAVITFVIIT